MHRDRQITVANNCGFRGNLSPSVKSGQIRNIESARVSMGGQVKK